jgi:anti-sigma regulatory factor (Ser/Thr protein kinase)
MAAGGGARSIRIPAEAERLADVRAFVRSAAVDFGAAPSVVDDIVQAVDEAACNIVVHGYAGEPGDIEVEAALAGQRIEIRLLDRSGPFDPTAAPSADVDVPPLRRRPGGMGIHLVRSTMDEVHHRARDDGGNELRLVRAIDEPPARPDEED